MGIASIIALGIYVFTDLFSTLVGIFGFILSFIVISHRGGRCCPTGCRTSSRRRP